MAFTRREVLAGGGLVFCSTVATNKLRAETIADLHVSRAAEIELSDVWAQATAIGIELPAGGRMPSQTSRIDLAAVILEALERGPSDKRAAALAKRAGLLLNNLNRVERDLPAPVFAHRPPPPFDKQEKANLRKDFESCKVADSHKTEIAKAVGLISSPKAKARYQEVANATKVPWYAIGAIHYREANLNFLGHLHNGDRLDRKTTHVPPHRPRGAWPPVPYESASAWRMSAVDALHEFDGINSWTLEQMLFGFEKYNGFGYRPHHIKSPYVWNYSQFYTRGGFPCDGCWSDTYVSKQAGLAVIIKALKEADSDAINLTYETLT